MTSVITFRNGSTRGTRFVNTNARTGVIYLYDEVGKNPLMGGGISAQDFRGLLNDLGPVTTIDLFVNSPGGSCFEGFAIMSLLQRHPARKRAFVDGVAASMASAIVCACDEVSMAPHAMMMIHNCHTDAADISNSDREAMKRIDAQLADLYAKRAGIARALAVRMMKEESWFTSREAVSLGLADRIHEPVRIAASWAGEWPRFDYRNAPQPPRLVEDGTWTLNEVHEARRGDLLWRPSLHESAHAVGVWSSGEPVDVIDAIARSDGSGAMRHKGIWWKASNEAIMSACGAAAEAHFGVGAGKMQRNDSGCDGPRYDDAAALANIGKSRWDYQDKYYNRACDKVEAYQAHIVLMGDMLYRHGDGPVSGAALQYLYQAGYNVTMQSRIPKWKWSNA